MDTINVQGFKIDIRHFDEQISKNGRPFRLSGVSLVTTKPQEWVGKMLFHNTIYHFRYLDADEFFAFEFDPKGNFLCKVNLD